MQDLFTLHSFAQFSERIHGDWGQCGVEVHCHGEDHLEEYRVLLAHLLRAVHDHKISKELHQR